MLIGIEAHSLEGRRTGVGRMLFNLLKVWSQLCHSEAEGRRISDRSFPRCCGVGMTQEIKFILYFKDEIPTDLPRADFFESKLLKVGSTAKFIHWDLSRAAKKDKVDVLFCPGYVAPIFWKGKIALTLHDISYEAYPQYFNWQRQADKILLKWVSKKSAQKAKVIFVPSEFTKKEVMRLYGANEEKIVLTPLAADDDFKNPPPSPSPFLRGRVGRKAPRGPRPFSGAGGSTPKSKFGLFVGSFFDRRHLPEIFEAFGKVGNQYKNYQLVIVGRDYTKAKNIDSEIKIINKNLNREAILRFDFFSDSDLKSLYGAGAFFIYLSDYEGFGLPPLEAMEAGAPVITSAGNSLQEVAGQAALLIKNNSDVKEIQAAMERIISDENFRKELIEKGKAQAAKFSWQKCAEKTLEWLMKI